MIQRFATELLPRLVVTVTKPEEAMDDYITVFSGQIEGIAANVRRNEKLESEFVRRDTDDACVMTVYFSDHKAMQEICEYIVESVSDIAEKFNLDVKYEVKE